MKWFRLLQKWLALKYSYSWHPDCDCWAGDAREKSLPHLMPCGEIGSCWLHSKLNQEIPITLGSWKSSLTGPKVKILNYHHHQRRRRWHVLKRPYHIISYYQMKSDSLFTDGSCCIVETHLKMESCWTPMRQATEATEGQGGSSQVVQLKAILLVLNITEWDKMANTLPLQWVTDSCKCSVGVAGLMEKDQLALERENHLGCCTVARHNCSGREVHCGSLSCRCSLYLRAGLLKNTTTGEGWTQLPSLKCLRCIWTGNVRVNYLFLPQWAHGTSHQQERDATHWQAHDWGLELTMDSISQVIHNCKPRTAIQQTKRVKPLWFNGLWWKVQGSLADWLYHTSTNPPQQALHAYNDRNNHWMAGDIPCALGHCLEHHLRPWKASPVAAWYPERTESANGTHFQNSLRDTWATVLSGYIISHTSLWENWSVQQTVKNHIESSKW